MKKNYLILIIAISAMGLVSGTYLKFIKSYQTGIQVYLQTKDGESQQRQINLSGNIDFLKEIDKKFTANGVERIHKDKLPEAIKRLKFINGISIALIISSTFLFLWSVQKLYKIKVVLKA